jgi:putative NADPH-quinone reductase
MKKIKVKEWFYPIYWATTPWIVQDYVFEIKTFWKWVTQNIKNGWKK